MSSQSPMPNKNPLTVVELFQSQGCSSCPPANDKVLNLVDQADMLVLTYDVTYWDYLGWRDTFGKPDFERRQREYAKALGRKNVFTPQVIVNGQVDGVGNSTKELESLIAKGASSSQQTVEVEVFSVNHGRGITVSGPSTQTGIVNVVRYDRRKHQVRIVRGENAGRTLPHGNVVREVTLLGDWQGGKKEFIMLPPLEEAGLNLAILVQAGPGGPILGSACI